MPPLLIELDPCFLWLIGITLAVPVVLLALFRKKGDRELANKTIDAIRENSEATDAMRKSMDRVSEDIRGLRRDLGGTHWSKRSKEP